MQPEYLSHVTDYNMYKVIAVGLTTFSAICLAFTLGLTIKRGRELSSMSEKITSKLKEQTSRLKMMLEDDISLEQSLPPITSYTSRNTTVIENSLEQYISPITNYNFSSPSPETLEFALN